MRKKTALRDPENPMASPNQPSGLIAKGRHPEESAQEKCVLDNHSHRTPRGLPAFASEGATFAPANGVTAANDPKGRERSERAALPAVSGIRTSGSNEGRASNTVAVSRLGADDPDSGFVARLSTIRLAAAAVR